MSHRSLFWPIALIATLALTLLMITVSAPTSHSSPLRLEPSACPTDGTDVAYPNCIQTQTAEAATPTTDPERILQGCPTNGPAENPPYPPYADCLKTRTALLLQTEATNHTSTPTLSSREVTSRLSTSTPTMTRTRTATAEGDLTPTQSASPTIAEATATPTDVPSAPSPSPEDEETEDALVCAPGSTIPIEGNADPRVGLIIFFGRRPVGGGFSRDDGSYRIWLRIGDERPGVYTVEVTNRGTNEVVQAFLCRVPALTPTLTPTQAR
ncbi:MAG: hypothetical protein HGA65_10110 [Oscillochloris sp.]|nr:hypothetical protein [Oscillochloris sp.]